MINESIIVDIEVYPNYFLVLFRSLRTEKIVAIDSSTKITEQDAVKIKTIILQKLTVGFNSWKYDIPMLNFIIENRPTVDRIYKKSKELIEGKIRPSSLYDIYNNPMKIKHIDLAEPAPAVMVSLKGYGARIGTKKLQDLPYEPTTVLSDEEKENIKTYCENDLAITKDLLDAIYSRLELRKEMSNKYAIDLMSKSDAQIAEAVFISELRYRGNAPELETLSVIRYIPPKCIEFKSELLKNLFDKIKSTHFTLDKRGSILLPKELANTKILMGKTTYKLGIGGLHSQEKTMVIKTDELNTLRNVDVASYYPSMILEFEWFPKHLGRNFLNVYRNIYNTRLNAKRNNDRVVSESLKIVLNGSFGKLGSKYSKLYSPDLMLHVTMTGQLMLLMLIEDFELNGITVVSSNTDGIEFFCPNDKTDLANLLILDWEIRTGMEMEQGAYKALYARDVNNYIAVYEDKVKAKGIFSESSLMKGRQCPIVFTAIRQFLLDGTRVEKTITECKDINEFVLTRTVKGGGIYKNTYLGKIVRWYWSREKDTVNIEYKTNGNKVPLSDSCKPIMEFNLFPEDLDYERYIEYAVSNMKTIGVNYYAE